MCDAFARVRVDDGEIELIFRGIEVNEEVVDFVEDFLGPCVCAINFVQNDHGWQFRS